MILKENEIHLWLYRYEGSFESDEILSDDEKARLRSILTPKAQEQFRISRTFLRRTLSYYLGTPPQELIFEYVGERKPRLAFPNTPVQFNLSHSESHLILAVSLKEVGVDLEMIRPRKQMEALAERHFSDLFYKYFKTLSETQQIPFFFRVWTLGEALLKAEGGTAFKIKSTLERLEPHTHPSQWLPDFDHLQIETTQSRVEAVTTWKSFTAAIAYAGARKSIRQFIAPPLYLEA